MINSAVNMDLLLGDKSLHTFGNSNPAESATILNDVLMAGGKAPLTEEAAKRNVTLLPRCATPWDFYHGRWVRNATAKGTFEADPTTDRPPWRVRARCLWSKANYFYNDRECCSLLSCFWPRVEFRIGRLSVCRSPIFPSLSLRLYH